MSLSDYYAYQSSLVNKKIEEEDGYLKKLKQTSATGIHLDTHASSHHLEEIKQKINQIVKEEVHKLKFKDQLAAEQLAEAQYEEVITKKNFFFGIDESKRDRNLKVHNFKAPGNTHRHPQVILPHEHVHVDHYIDIDGKDKEQLMELYGYYSFLVDLHIAQIRPENLEGKSYVPARFNQVNVEQAATYASMDNMNFEYYHRWREMAKPYNTPELDAKWKEQLANRPTTSHFDHDKGSKYEVEWREDQKFPHVATRLGYPELMEEPIERILGIERAPAHPGYQFQPFVQTPSMDPDPTLSFQKGEVIYENPRLLEWVRFWKVLISSTFGFAPFFYLFETYAADGMPSLDWIEENFNWWSIPKQFQDAGGWDLKNMRYCDDHDYMNMQYSVKRAIVRPEHTAYVIGLLTLMHNLNMDYVTKMVYNKDKDLVFVYKPEGLWFEKEFVYEMHHLEQLTPFVSSAIPNLSMQDDKGIVNVRCMATHQQNKFYNEDKYWNMELKDEFMSNTRNLWKGNYSDKRNGTIFGFEATPSKEIALTMQKVDRELAAAIKKHGECQPATLFEEELAKTINKKKMEIASSAL